MDQISRPHRLAVAACLTILVMVMAEPARAEKLNAEKLSWCEAAGRATEAGLVIYKVDPKLACKEQRQTLLVPADLGDDAWLEWQAAERGLLVTETRPYTRLQPLPSSVSDVSQIWWRRCQSTIGRATIAVPPRAVRVGMVARGHAVWIETWPENHPTVASCLLKEAKRLPIPLNDNRPFSVRLPIGDKVKNGKVKNGKGVAPGVMKLGAGQIGTRLRQADIESQLLQTPEKVIQCLRQGTPRQWHSITFALSANAKGAVYNVEVAAGAAPNPVLTCLQSRLQMLRLKPFREGPGQGGPWQEGPEQEERVEGVKLGATNGPKLAPRKTRQSGRAAKGNASRNVQSRHGRYTFHPYHAARVGAPLSGDRRGGYLSLSVCAAARRASTKRWTFRPQAVDCERLFPWRPEEEGGWFERQAVLNGFLLVETRSGTAVRPRPLALLGLSKKVRRRCSFGDWENPQTARRYPRPPPLEMHLRFKAHKVSWLASPERELAPATQRCVTKMIEESGFEPPGSERALARFGFHPGPVAWVWGSFGGELDHDTVQHFAIMEQTSIFRRRFAYCFERRTAGWVDNAAWREVRLRWHVTRDGSVDAVELLKSSAPDSTVACLKERIRSLYFTLPKGKDDAWFEHEFLGLDGFDLGGVIDGTDDAHDHGGHFDIGH